MSVEPFIAFFLTRYLRKSLRKFSPLPRLDQLLTILLFAIVILFIAEVSLPIEPEIVWVWPLLLLFIVWIAFRQPNLSQARNVMYAVLPLIVVTVWDDAIKFISIDFYNKVNNYTSLAYAAGLTWMITMLYRSNKEQKALEIERKKALEEEARSKLIALQNSKLEILVSERTAEITKQKEELQHTIEELKSTQSQLIQSEKMASLGELTAGIAHEIQNPLNFVNNFSEVNTELIDELMEDMDKLDTEAIKTVAHDIKQNNAKIIQHGKRADAIVKGMLQHSRKNTGLKELTDINALVDEYLRLSYHGLRAKDKTFNAAIKTDFDESVGSINVVPQDLGRVFLNLLNNAFHAVNAKKKTADENYQPAVFVSTRRSSSHAPEDNSDEIIITFKDNGNGIPENITDKIFQPFFTTKPTGEGTGLGLSLSYDIIKAHGGEIKVETKEGEGAEFIIKLPLS